MIQCRAQQARDKGIAVAHLHPATEPRQFQHMPRQTSCHMQRRPHRPRCRHEGAQVRPGLNRHAPEGRFLHRFAQQLHRVSQIARVIGLRDNRAATHARAGQVAVGIWDLCSAIEGQRGIVFEETDHFRRGGQKGIDQFGIERVAQDGFEIAARL